MFDKLDDQFYTDINFFGLKPILSTDMMVSKILSAETINLSVKQVHAKRWNGHQEYLINVNFSNTTFLFFWNIKHLVGDYIADWQQYSNEKISDMYSFIPCTYKVNVDLDNYEVIVPINMHNYVDIESLEDPNQGPSRFQRQKDGAAGSAFNHQFQDGTTHDSSNFLHVNTAYDQDMNNPYDSSFEIGNRQKRSRFQSGKTTQTESDSTKKKDQNKTIGNACLETIQYILTNPVPTPFPARSRPVLR